MSYDFISTSTNLFTVLFLLFFRQCILRAVWWPRPGVGRAGGGAAPRLRPRTSRPTRTSAMKTTAQPRPTLASAPGSEVGYCRAGLLRSKCGDLSTQISPVDCWSVSAPQSTYICRVQSCVWRLPKYWPPTPLSTQRVCPRPAPKAGGTYSPGGEGGEGVGGSIFWNTPNIGLASYSIISLRLEVKMICPRKSPFWTVGQSSLSIPRLGEMAQFLCWL